MPPFVALVRGQLDRAKAINNNLFGLQQFVIGKPIWEAYLKGEEPDPEGRDAEGHGRRASRDEEGLTRVAASAGGARHAAAGRRCVAARRARVAELGVGVLSANAVAWRMA